MIDDWRPENGPAAHEYDWFWTEGGPFILLPGELLLYWRGIDPSMDESAPATRFRWTLNPNEPASDYDRACDALEQKDAALLRVGPGQGLVFDEENLQYTWRPAETKEQYDEGIFVGWRHADTEESALQSLGAIPSEVWHKEDLIFTAGDQPSYLIDSGMPGDELGRADYRVIKLQPGAYAVFTANYEPDEHTSLFLVRLVHTAKLAGAEVGQS